MRSRVDVVRVATIAAACTLLIASATACRRDADEKKDSKEVKEKGAKEEEKPFKVEPSKEGEPVVVLTADAFAAAGIAIVDATAREVADESESVGVLVADPSRVAVLRAPVAGTIESAKGGGDASRWPVVGAQLEGGVTIGTFQPRTAPLTTAELADLQSRLAAARAEQIGTQAELDAAKAALERAKKLNALDKGVSDQTVEAAAATVKASEAKLDAAKTSVAIFEKVANSQGAVVLPPTPLVAPRSGEVVAVLAQPGENVEAGAELVRVADFGELFVDVRSRELSPKSARVVVNDASFDATVVGPAPESSAFAPLLRLRVRDPAKRLRPGLGVSAWLDVGGARVKVVAIPRSAALRYASRTWVYVQTEEREFTRRAITVLRTDGDALLTAAGLDASAKVVSAGATTLLSQEQLAAGGGEGE